MNEYFSLSIFQIFNITMNALFSALSNSSYAHGIILLYYYYYYPTVKSVVTPAIFELLTERA